MSDLAHRLQSALGADYVVERELGAGGFAVVFLVRDLSLKRHLAVKVLSPDLITSHSVLERFRREAETVARLSHPNIVPLHFFGQKDDLLYLVMAYVDGSSVGDRLTREGLPVEDARRIMSEVASALAHAHKHGVIHRDIKPQNVLIDSESGRCLVTDFGIARTADGGTLTATGMFVGTPAYLAPEQIEGTPSDHRADIYALGVMSYEMFAGRQPFEGATPTAMLMKRLAGPPEKLSKVRPETPRVVQATIERCLAQDPEARFQSASDVVQSLASEVTQVESGGLKLRLGMIGAGLALIATAIIAVVAVQSRKTPDVAAPPPAPLAGSGMVVIPAGDYRIGSDSGAVAARPAHTVSLAAFGIDRLEVTVGDYQRFIDSTGAAIPWSGANPDATIPVTGVHQTEAAAFCAWRHPNGGRLPTEQEWEAAARGLTGPPAGNTRGAGAGAPVAAGSHPGAATPGGIRDLIGNVWEWTSSPMQSYPGGSALPDSMSKFRVIRGGAFNTPDSMASVFIRGYALPTASRDALLSTGFRCAMAAKSVVPSYTRQDRRRDRDGPETANREPVVEELRLSRW